MVRLKHSSTLRERSGHIEMTVMETDNGLCLTVVIVLLQLCPPLAANICLHEIQSNRNPAKKENQIRLSSKKIEINSHKKEGIPWRRFITTTTTTLTIVNDDIDNDNDNDAEL